MQHRLTPSYLSELIPIQTQDRYRLRNASNTPLVPARTQLFNLSFLPATIRDWNSLSNPTRNSPSITSFKYTLNSSMRKPPPHYNVGCRLGQILHSRLRLGCSSLNYDLHRKSIVDSPLCECGSVETVKHFFLGCYKYSTLRTNMLSGIPCPATIDNLLRGNDHLTLEQNNTLFLSVHQYILASKRFSS